MVAFVDCPAEEVGLLTCCCSLTSISWAKFVIFKFVRRVTILALLSDVCPICTLKSSEEAFKLLSTVFVSSLNLASIYSISSDWYLCLSPVTELLMRGEPMKEDEGDTFTRIEKMMWFSRPFDSTSIVPLFYLMMLWQISWPREPSRLLRAPLRKFIRPPRFYELETMTESIPPAWFVDT